MGEVRDDIRWRNAKAAETALGEAWDAASTEDARHMGQTTRTGAWLSEILSTVNRTELGAQEWRDSLFLSYGINPPQLTGSLQWMWRGI